MISDRHPILVVNDNIARRKPLGYGMTVTIMPRRNYPCSLGFGSNQICWRGRVCSALFMIGKKTKKKSTIQV